MKEHRVDSIVQERYSVAAHRAEAELCCAVNYSQGSLEAIPSEILERDYGCGDPSPHVQPGEVVLDLGSGGGKLCYVLAQVVGPDGQVIGVDCNVDMLGLARRHQAEVAERLGYDNVDFRCGRIQDLQLDLERLAAEFRNEPVASATDILEMRETEDRLRRERPLIADETIDCVVSNCVLNLVARTDRSLLFSEIYRVLKNGGRAVISDIVCDEDVPRRLQADPHLWSGCVSGAWREDEFPKAFESAGFHGIEIAEYQTAPWQTINGIQFRSMTVVAYKGKEGPCLEHRQALIYRGPFKKVEDDDGHVFHRGERMAVCDKTFRLLQKTPYEALFEPVQPRNQISPEDAKLFDCRRSVRRHPKETKGEDYDETSSVDCSSDGCC